MMTVLRSREMCAVIPDGTRVLIFGGPETPPCALNADKTLTIWEGCEDYNRLMREIFERGPIGHLDIDLRPTRVGAKLVYFPTKREFHHLDGRVIKTRGDLFLQDIVGYSVHKEGGMYRFYGPEGDLICTERNVEEGNVKFCYPYLIYPEYVRMVGDVIGGFYRTPPYADPSLKTIYDGVVFESIGTEIFVWTLNNRNLLKIIENFKTVQHLFHVPVGLKTVILVGRVEDGSTYFVVYNL
jgi:hypothetical protein